SKANLELRAWAGKRRGQQVDQSQQDLAEHFGLSQGAVSRILPDYDITTSGVPCTQGSKEGQKLRAWAEKHRGQQINASQQELAKKFGLSQGTVARILPDYDITTRGGASLKGGQKLRAWAEKHRRQQVDQYQKDLAEHFGLSQGAVSRILPDYDI